MVGRFPRVLLVHFGAKVLDCLRRVHVYSPYGLWLEDRNILTVYCGI